MSSIPLIESRPLEPRVGMVMTGAAFDAARRADLVSIEADLSAMAFIAHYVGSIGSNEVEALPPQLFVVRDTSKDRSLVSRWDTRVPADASSPVTERYFWAADLVSDTPRSVDRIKLIEAAHTMGATALTEVSVPAWDDDSLLASAYAAGLTWTQKPVDASVKRPPLVLRIAKEVRDTTLHRTSRKLQLIDEVKTMAQRDTLPIAPPFVLHRRVVPKLGS